MIADLCDAVEELQEMMAPKVEPAVIMTPGVVEMPLVLDPVKPLEIEPVEKESGKAFAKKVHSAMVDSSEHEDAVAEPIEDIDEEETDTDEPEDLKDE